MRKVLNFVKGRRGGGSSTGGEETPLDSPNIDASEDAIAASFHEYGGYRLDLTGRDKSITKLHKAAWLGTLDKIRPWLKKATSADLDAVDREGRTPLHLAAARGHAMLLVTLLDHKANPNICDGEGKTPFLKAIECGQRECVQLLLERNLGDRQLADRLGNTALHIACANGHIDLASLLLKQGIANTESCNVNGEVALHVATLSGHRDCAELLLRHGASANVVDRDNRSPLMYAARAGDATLVRTLLEYGAQKQVMDSNDWTAEDHAQQMGHVAVAAELKSASSSTEGLPSIAPFNKKDSIPILSKSNSLSGSDATSWTGGGGGLTANETNSNHSKVAPISKLVPATSSEDEGKASPGCVIPPPCKPPRSWELIQSGVIDQGGAEPRRRSLLTLGSLRSKRESFTESLTDSAASPHDDSPAGTLAPGGSNHTNQHAQATDSAQWIPSHSFSKHDSLGANNVVTIGEPTEPSSSKPPSIHQKGASDEAASDWDSDESLPLDSNSNQTTQQQPPISGLTSLEGKPPLLRTPSIDLPDDSIFPGVIGQITEHSEEKETNLTPVGTLGRDGTLQGRDEIWAANATTCANSLAPPVRPDRLLFASPGIGAPFKSSRSLDAAVPSRSLDGFEDHPVPLGAPQPPPRRVRSHARNRSVSVQSWSTLPAALGPSSSYYDAATSVCAQSSMAGVGVPAPSFDRVLADNRHINAQLECYDQALRELAQVALVKPRPPSVTAKYLSLPRTHELIDEAFREMGPPAQRHASSLPRHMVPPIHRTSSGGAESDSDDEEEDSDSPLLSTGAAKKIYSRPDKQVPDDRRSSEDEGGSVTTMVVHVQIEPGPPATSSDSDMKDTICSGTEDDNEPLITKIKQEELNTDEIKTETPKNEFNAPISSIDRPLKFDAVKETIIEDIKECNSKSEEEEDDERLIKEKISEPKKEMVKLEETVEEEEEEDDGPPSESPPPPPIIDVIDDTIQEDGEDLLATPRSGTSDVTVRTASLERPASSLAQRRRRTALLAMRDLADRSGAGSEEEDEPPFWISARQATVVERIDFIPPELDPNRSLMDALRKPQVSSIVIHSVAEQVPVTDLENGEIRGVDEIVGNGLGGGVHSSPEHPDLSSISADIEGELKSPDLISDGESGFSHNELTPQHNYSFKTPRHAALQAQLREATRDRGRLEECCAELSERGDRLKYELAEAQEVAHSRHDVIALLQGQIAQLEILYTSSLEEIQGCRLKLGNRDQELKHLHEICSKYEDEKIHVQEYISKIEFDKISLEKMLFIKEEEKRLQAQAIEKGKERLEKELSIIREEKRRLSAENAQLLLRTDELQRQLSEAAQTTKELLQDKQRLEADNARHLQSIEADLKKWRELSTADGKASGSVSTGLKEHLNDMLAKLEEVKERDCSLWQNKLKEEVSSAVLVLQSEYSKLEGSLSRHNSKLQRELDASSARQTELESQLRQAQADLLAASLDAAQARATASLAETLRQLNSDLKNQLEQQQRRLHDQEMELRQLRTPMCYPPPPPPLDSSEEEMDAPSPPPPPSPPSCHHPETKEQLKSLEMEVTRLKADLAISNKIQQGPSIQQQMLEQANNDLRSRVEKLQVELRVAEEARVREAEERAVSQTNHLLEMSRLVDALRDDNNALRVQLEQQQTSTPSKMIQGEKECNLTLNTWANPEVVAFRLNLEGESNGNVHPPNTLPIRNSRDAATNTAFTLNIQNQELKNELQVERERTKKLQQSLKKARADLTAAKGSSTQSLPSVCSNNKIEKADVNMALLKQNSCSVIDYQKMINELEQKIKEEKTARYGLEALINNMQHDIKDKVELERELASVRAKIGTDFISKHEVDAMRRGYELAVSRARMEAESVARDSLNARLAQFNAYLEVEENSIDLEKQESQAETQNRALATDLARIQQGLSAVSAAAAAATNLEDPKNRELIDKAMSLPTPQVIVQATPTKELPSPRSPLLSGGQVALKPSSPLSGPNPFTQLLHLELEKTVLKNSQSGEMKSDRQTSKNNIIKKSDDDLERLKKKYFLQ